MADGITLESTGKIPVEEEGLSPEQYASAFTPLNVAPLPEEVPPTQELTLQEELRQGVVVPTDPKVIDRRVEKYHFALGDERSPGKEALRDTIISGDENLERRRQALIQVSQDERTRQELVKKYLQSQPADRKATASDLEALQRLSSTDLRSIAKNPDLLLERLYAVRQVNLGVDPRVVSEAEKELGVEGTQKVLDTTQNFLTRKEGFQRIQEEMQEKWGEAGLGSTVLNYAGQFVPLLSQFNKYNVVKGSKSTSLLPGNELKEQIEHLWLLPPDEAVVKAKEAVEDIAKRSTLDALTFAHALTSYSNSEQAIDNIFTGLDLVGLGTGRAATAATRRLASSLREVVARNSGSRMATSVDLLEAQGKIKEAALEQTVRDITDVANKSGARVDSFDEIKQAVPSIMNPQATFFSGTTNFSRDMVARLKTVMASNADTLLKAVVNDPVNITRLSEGGPAMQAALRETEQLFNIQYPHLNNTVLDVGVRYSTETETLTNNSIAVFSIGDKAGGLWNTEKSARLAGELLYDLNDFAVKPRGNGWYIEITKPIDETSDAVLNGLRIETRATTPRTLTNAFFNLIRTPESTAPNAIQRAKKLTVTGASGLEAVMARMAEPLSGLGRRERTRLIEYTAQERANRTFANSLGEFERNWQTQFNRRPSEKEATAYFTSRQINDIDYVARNLSIYKDKIRAGMEMHKIEFPDLKMKGHTIEGKIVQNIEWIREETPTVMTISGNSRNGVQVLRSRQKVEEFLKANPGAKIIHLSQWGAETLEKLPNIGRVVGNRGRPDFIITTNTTTSRPLSFRQIPYEAGGHRVYRDGWYISQPNIRPVRGVNRDPENQYYGDLNVFFSDTETKARRFADRLEQARRLFLAGDQAALDAYARNNLPVSGDWVRGVFAPADQGGYLNPNIPILVRKSDTTTHDVHNLSTQFANFRDKRSSYYDPFKGQINLEFATRRNEPVHAIDEVGGATPIYNLEPAPFIDAITTVNRSARDVIENRYVDDLKIKQSQHFIAEFAEVLDWDMNKLNRNPMGALFNAPIKKDHPDRAAVAAAQTFRRQAIEFLNTKSDFEKVTDNVRQRLADSIYERMGTQSFEAVRPYLLARTADPVQFAKNVAFHTKLGFFNPVQLFLQAQTTAHIAGVEGPMRAVQGVGVGSLMRMSRLNDNPAIINDLANKSRIFGWTPEQFKESLEAYNRSGWGNVGREVAMLDDFSEGAVVKTKLGKFLDAGTVFFREGELFTRTTAWNASYMRWREANPTAVLDDKAISTILDRADLLTVNMTRASNASWQKGIASVPTQFWAYQSRLMEQFIGGRLTNAEKARAFATYSALYGVPVAGSAAVGVWPIQETVEKYLQEKGIAKDDNVVAEILLRGIPDMALEALTGNDYNLGERYGPGGLSFFKDLYRGDKSALELFGGVSGTSLADFMSRVSPLVGSLYASTVEDDTFFPVGLTHFNDLAKSVSTYSQVEKAWVAINTGKYLSKNKEFIENVDGWDAVFMGLTGLTPQSVNNMYMQLEQRKDEKTFQKKFIDEAVRYYRLGISAEGDDERIEYFKKAKTRLIAGGLSPTQVSGVLQQAFKGYESKVEKVDRDFMTRSPDRLEAYFNKTRKQD